MAGERYLGDVGRYVPDALVIIAPEDGRLLDANDAAEKLWGYSRDELLQLSVFDLRTDAANVGLVRGQLQSASSSDGVQFETEHRRKDGTTLPVEVSTRSGEVNGRRVIVTSIRDISRRREWEQKQRDSEERFRLFTEVAFEGVIIHDAGVIVDISPAIARMSGHEVEELIGRSFFDFTLPETRTRVLGNIERGEIERGYVTTALRKDGSSFPIEVSSKTVMYRGRELRAVSVRDVSERIHTEQQLRRSEESFRSMIERSPYGVAVSRDNRMVYANPTFTRMLGHADAAEIVGRAPSDFVPPELHEPVRASIKVGSQPGTVTSSDRQLRRKDGSLVHAHVVGFQVHFEGVPASMGIFEDVTETRRLEEQLRQAQKMEAVGRLAGGVAHDFNNLLTAILGHAELLQQSLSPGTVERRQAEQVHRAALRGSQLTGQLLAFSRKQVLQPKVLDMNAVVSGMTSMLQRLIGEDVELEEDLQPSLWPVHADQGQLEQVLMNLAVNARDAMPRGGQLSIRTRNLSRDEAAALGLTLRSVVLEVRDSGHGMTPETRARVFEPFFTTKPRGKGTGLGLATVYGIVAQSGGQITVDSEPGRGALFRVLLPAVEGLPARSGVNAEGVVVGGGETILLVEDDADVRQFVADVLATNGYKVLQAKDGPEALQLAGAHAGTLHLLVTDVVMPRMTGADVAVQLKRERPSLKVLFISGYPGETMVRQGVLAAELFFLQKPFSVGELSRRVRDLLDAP